MSTISKIYKNGTTSSHAYPFIEESVSAGFPSSADNSVFEPLDLNELLIKHPAATYFVKVSGDSMRGAGINSGDILIVDRAAPVHHNAIVVAHINGEFTVKRILLGKQITLVPENENYKPIVITESMDFEIWGVVTFVIHAAR